MTVLWLQTTRLSSPSATTSKLLYKDTLYLMPKWKQSLDANVPPSAKKKITTSEALMQHSHSAWPMGPLPVPSMQWSQSAQVHFIISTNNPCILFAICQETPSMRIQITMAQVQQCDSQDQSLIQQARTSRSNTLATMEMLNTLFLYSGDTSHLCWVSNLPYDHSFLDYTRTARGWGNMGQHYQMFKSLWHPGFRVQVWQNVWTWTSWQVQVQVLTELEPQVWTLSLISLIDMGLVRWQ